MYRKGNEMFSSILSVMEVSIIMSKYEQRTCILLSIINSQKIQGHTEVNIYIEVKFVSNANCLNKNKSNVFRFVICHKANLSIK